MQGPSSFFQSIIDPVRYKDVDSVIVVIHAGVEVDNFLQAISQIARIAAVIPKNSSKKFSNLALKFSKSVKTFPRAFIFIYKLSDRP